MVNPALALSTNDFFRTIKDRFYPTDFVQSLQSKLAKLRQNTSVQQYNTKFEETLFQIPCTKFTEADMKDVYLCRLKPEVCIWVMIMNVPTLLQAMQATQ